MLHTLGAVAARPTAARSCRSCRGATAMASSTATPVAVQPAIIVGAGRVGAALERMGDGKDIMVRRNDAVPATGPAMPILVATRNDALDAIIAATPAERRKDLVFMQNGMLEPFLAAKGLADATQVLIYFAVAKLGEMPTDGRTDTNPEGLTAACGPWADAVAARLHRQGLACHVLPKAEFRACMFEKLIWISAFMLVGAAHPGATVGVVESQHKAQVVALIDELAAGVRKADPSVVFGPHLADRLCAYARSVSHFPTAVKEFEWRNGYFYSLTQQALAKHQPDPFPQHTALLKAVKAVK